MNTDQSEDFRREAHREALETGSGFTPERARIELGEKVVAGTTELPSPLGPNRDRSHWGNKRIGEGEMRIDEDPSFQRGPELDVEARQRSDDALAAQLAESPDVFDSALWERVVREVPTNTYDPAISDKDRKNKYAVYQQAKREGRFR